MNRKPLKSVRVRITGQVQGVGFRAWLRREAVALGLSGWVRNRRSGAVEAVFEGPDDDVDAIIDACRTGPRWAKVENVEVEASDLPGPAGFHVRKTE